MVCGLTLPGLEPTIYRTQGEHANYYTTDAVLLVSDTPTHRDQKQQSHKMTEIPIHLYTKCLGIWVISFDDCYRSLWVGVYR